MCLWRGAHALNIFLTGICKLYQSNESGVLGGAGLCSLPSGKSLLQVKRRTSSWKRRRMPQREQVQQKLFRHGLLVRYTCLSPAWVHMSLLHVVVFWRIIWPCVFAFFFCLFCWCRAWLHRSFPPASLAALQGTAYEWKAFESVLYCMTVNNPASFRVNFRTRCVYVTGRWS